MFALVYIVLGDLAGYQCKRLSATLITRGLPFERYTKKKVGAYYDNLSAMQGIPYIILFVLRMVADQSP